MTCAGAAAHLLEQAVNAALGARGVAVLTLPGDVGDLDVARACGPPRSRRPPRPRGPVAQAHRRVAAALADAPVTLLVGVRAREARDEVLELADALAAPMVLTLKAKEGLEHDNPFEVGQSGLIGNPAAAKAMDDCDVLVLVGTDFPYRDWYPTGKTVIQLDARRGARRAPHPVQHALVGDAAATLDPGAAARPTRGPRRTSRRPRGIRAVA